MSDVALEVFDDAFPSRNIRHHFAGQDDDRGVYAKELLVPAGWILRSHKHDYDHLSIIASGVAHLTVGPATRVVCGPEMIVVKKGEAHELRAVTPVTWYCIHPTGETDPDKVDDVILTKGSA